MAGISDKALNKLSSQYKFNGGVELEEEFGINLYSTFYRQYDPQLGRFSGVDMLSQQSHGLSPYQFALNDPILFNDPMGDYAISQNDIDRMWANPNGGTWSASTGQVELFGSQEEALFAGAAYMDRSNMWGGGGGGGNGSGGSGGGSGWATSLENAIDNFNKLRPEEPQLMAPIYVKATKTANGLAYDWGDSGLCKSTFNFQTVIKIDDNSGGWQVAGVSNLAHNLMYYDGVSRKLKYTRIALPVIYFGLPILTKKNDLFTNKRAAEIADKAVRNADRDLENKFLESPATANVIGLSLFFRNRINFYMGQYGGSATLVPPKGSEDIEVRRAEYSVWCD